MHKMIQLLQEMTTFYVFMATLSIFLPGGTICI